jgi:hypothetical protein
VNVWCHLTSEVIGEGRDGDYRATISRISPIIHTSPLLQTVPVADRREGRDGIPDVRGWALVEAAIRYGRIDEFPVSFIGPELRHKD